MPPKSPLETAGSGDDRLDPVLVRSLSEHEAPRGPIVLIGPMAAGKSFLALHLAKFHGYKFVDADQLIVSRHGVISEIFETYGERYFRDLEADTIAEVLGDPEYEGAVFSVGGGAPMTPRVRERLAAHRVVYLRIDAETVAPRIAGNTSRPMLRPDPVARWTEILEQRRETYEALADVVIDASGDRSIADMAQELDGAIRGLTGDR